MKHTPLPGDFAILNLLRSQLVQSQSIEIAVITEQTLFERMSFARQCCEVLEDIANTYLDIAEHIHDLGADPEARGVPEDVIYRQVGE